MSNSHQLRRNKSYNYWVMDKTKDAEGNLHNKGEAAESSFLAILTANNLHFYVAERSRVCSGKPESQQVEQSESAAPCRSKQTRKALFTNPPTPPKNKNTFRTIWKVCVAHNRLLPPLMTSSKQTWQKIEKESTVVWLTHWKGFQMSGTTTTVCDVTSHGVKKKRNS